MSQETREEAPATNPGSFRGVGWYCAGHVRNHPLAKASYQVSIRTPLTNPNHRRINGSTRHTLCSQAAIPRDDFLAAHGRA